MTVLVKWLSFTILLSALFGAEAQTINAASCSSTDVQKALNSVSADGSAVNIPAGNCTWTTTVTYNQVYSTTIQGQTTCSGTPASSCADNTVITSNMSGDIPILQLTATAGKSLRLTGITFALIGQPTYPGTVRIFGTSTAFRADHLHFKQIANGAMEVGGCVYGVLDHSLIEFSNGSTWNGVRTDQGGCNNDPLGKGDQSYHAATGLGSANFFFMEDNTFNGQTSGSGSTTAPFVNDCSSGGRYVVRHNIINGPQMQEHGTGHGGRDRGCRAWEIYSNTFSGNSTASPAYNVHYMTNGTGVDWGNTVSGYYQSYITEHTTRVSACASGNYAQAPPTGNPQGWGYCGNSSDMDQNSSGGYACMDQPGRGQGDLLVNDFYPWNGTGVVNNATGVAAESGNSTWPRQALEPIYSWSNTWSQVPTWPGSIWGACASVVSQNRDYYLSTGASCSGSSCTSGVGVGTLSQRPANCTTNSAEYPTGNHPGVGYWATDQNTLYVCTATNTWTSYYKPYTYPHPLTGTALAAPTGTGPLAPTGLTATVQ